MDAYEAHRQESFAARGRGNHDAADTHMNTAMSHKYAAGQGPEASPPPTSVGAAQAAARDQSLKRSMRPRFDMSKSEKRGGLANLLDYMRYILEKGEPNLMPSGEPGMSAGLEALRPQDGASLANTPHCDEARTSQPTPAVDAPSVRSKKLSEDDEDEDEQMKPHQKPIENSTRKSFGPDGGYTRQEFEHSMSVQRGAAERRLHAEDDVRIGIGQRGIPQTITKAEQPKAREWSQGPESRFNYSDAADIAASELAKGGTFYHGQSPSLDPNIPTQRMVMCKSCENAHVSMLSECPHCGAGRTNSSAYPGVTLGGSDTRIEKSESGLRLRACDDVYLGK
jgi:hypothetical protein